MKHNKDDLPLLKKRLYYRSMRRGMKELDLLLGGFAKTSLSGLSAWECALFSTLLDVHEPVLLAYFLTPDFNHEQPQDSMEFLFGTSLETKLRQYLCSNYSKAS